MKRFEKKTVLITGAASGIGFVTAQQFALEGAQVIATDINIDALETVFREDLANGLKIETRRQDVTSKAEWEALVDDVVAKHGHLDVMFSNAGSADFALCEDTSEERWRWVNALNVDSVFFGMQACIRVMKENGGSIINNSSIAGVIGEPLLAAYCATKGAVRTMTKAVAIDCARQGYPIRINSIHPGWTDTALVDNLLAALGDKGTEFANKTVGAVPMGRLGTPIEIARPVLFLASDDASFMTGAELIVDGGYTAA
ncbi:SDR family NAD(P)-dependent oxidoreductase [Granulosicoccus antarcticus]|uniref:Cyclopentanol dehydrogenase n=1 Tax=Granulosicoccus antarcticus IMCC3135 TaxID=1192854 RepID=A0A2Z2NWG3_9GAMM|nr:glucose 1-dehydrogenase [Granulosicoccus antarcticus]ASJ72047.1 Cyclopentanol dehydrogenase [Granulosicoccus antarcticus IMCC3135]